MNSISQAVERVAHTYHRKSELLSLFITEWAMISTAAFLALWTVNIDEHAYSELVHHIEVSSSLTAPYLFAALPFIAGYLVIREEEVSGVHTNLRQQGIKIVLVAIAFGSWFIVAGNLLDWNLHDVANKFLMTAFFSIAMIGIRIGMQKNGPLHGRNIILPAFSTLGGVIIPAGIYLFLAIVIDPALARNGWGTAVPTDIAFAVTAIVISAYKNHRATPVTYLMTVAVLDDLIGIGVIAGWYTRPELRDVFWAALLFGAGTVLTEFMRKYGVRDCNAYAFAPGQIHWWALYVLGVEPAIGFFYIIARMPIDPPLEDEEYEILEELEDGEEGFEYDELEEFEDVHHHTKPVHVMEKLYAQPVIYILALFSLVNAGVKIEGDSFENGFWFVIAGLAIGKPVGIVLFTLLGCKLFRIPLPQGMGIHDLILVGLFAGMGFTVSLFISETAFSDESILAAHKAGAMAATIVSFIAGFTYAKLRGIGPVPPKTKRRLRSVMKPVEMTT